VWCGSERFQAAGAASTSSGADRSTLLALALADRQKSVALLGLFRQCADVCARVTGVSMALTARGLAPRHTANSDHYDPENVGEPFYFPNLKFSTAVNPSLF
jgi:hypothetical protein